MSDLLIGKLIQLKPGFVVVPCSVMSHGYDCVVVHNSNPEMRCYPVGGFNISLSLDQLVGPPMISLGELMLTDEKLAQARDRIREPEDSP